MIQGETAYVQAGAGIVYDSVPANEWAETMNKARAIFRAVALAEAGLDSQFQSTNFWINFFRLCFSCGSV